MEFDKNGILNRAKAAQQTAAVMDEGLRADRKSTRLNSSHSQQSRMPSSA